MKKFLFPLQKLLDYKEQMLDIERTSLAQMNAVLAAFSKELSVLQKQHESRAAEFREKSKEGMPIVEMEIHKNYLSSLEDSIKNKKQQIKLQRAAVDKQQTKVRDVKIEVSTMEKLRERRLEEYNLKARKTEEIFIEEFISYKRAAQLVQKTG